jgi:hypothetical protein
MKAAAGGGLEATLRFQIILQEREEGSGRGLSPEGF